MGPLLAPAGPGLLLGLRPAFEPHHPAAASTPPPRQRRPGDACRPWLPRAAGPSRTAQLDYCFALAGGTMIGMLGVSLSLAAIVRLASGQGARWATALHVAAAVTSVGVGFVLAARVAAGL